ncbi:MAG: type II toxin-antitoxin system PrlF family antitoxin [Burkholderiaceae bacterium]|nr:type II toxin-antitoxin system PrlF family antitoxin [Burkholderiaceae bacterium]
MAATLEVESTLTDRYQTTVPETVRRALKLCKRDKIHYIIRANGEVVLTRSQSAEAVDPVLDQFLAFLANDMAKHPDRIKAVDPALPQYLHSLVTGIEVDLESPLSDADE